MKKIIIFFLLIIVIISIIIYTYQNYLIRYNNAKKENEKFAMYIEKEILGSELPTVINKAMDLNTRNGVEKDESGKYKDNEENSINIDVKFIEDTITKKFLTCNMEIIYEVGVENLLINYRDATFQCNKVEYHKKTGKIKYMVFEQIT